MEAEAADEENLPLEQQQEEEEGRGGDMHEEVHIKDDPEARRQATVEEAMEELENEAEADLDPDFDPADFDEGGAPTRMRTRPSNKLLRFARGSHKPRLLRPPASTSPPPASVMKQARVILEDLNDSLNTERQFQGPRGGGGGGEESGDEGGEAGVHSVCCVEGCKNTGVNKAMYFFPSRDQVQLAKWAEVVKNGKSFRPNRNHRVCEDHFYTGKPSPTNIHPDYVPSILPWNDSHRPETEEELQEFNAMMETKKREIQSIIDKKFEMLSKLSNKRRRGLMATAEGSTRPRRQRLIRKVKEELSDDDDDYVAPAPPPQRSWQRTTKATASSAAAAANKRPQQLAREQKAQVDKATAITNLRSELERQKTFVRNLQKMYAKAQEDVKEEKKKRKVAEIRCKFLEDKNRGLFDRCKQYAEGKKPPTPLAPSSGVVVRDQRSMLMNLRMRGTQFRERDYADPNAEMSEEEVSLFDPRPSSNKKKKKGRRGRAAAMARAAADMDDTDSEEEDEDEENEGEDEVGEEEGGGESSSPRKKIKKEPPLELPKIPNVPTSIKKNLQRVSVTDVPPEVKKAFQNVLKEKQKLQPVPSAAVPLAVQKAVRQDGGPNKASPAKQKASYVQDVQTVTEVVVDDNAVAATSAASTSASASGTTSTSSFVPTTILSVPAEILSEGGGEQQQQQQQQKQRTVVFQSHHRR